MAAIHESAFKLLRDERYEAVPVSRIAKEAGVAVGTFYRFYPTKMALLEAMSDSLEGHFVAAMTAAWAAGQGYDDKLALLSRSLFDTIDAHRDQIGVMQVTAGHRSSSSQPVGAQVRHGIALFYADGVKHGYFYRHDPQTFAAAAHGMVEGLMRQFLERPTADRKEYHVATLTDLMRRLVKA